MMTEPELIIYESVEQKDASIETPHFQPSLIDEISESIDTASATEDIIKRLQQELWVLNERLG